MIGPKMITEELFQMALNITEPWEVKDIKFNIEDKKLDYGLVQDEMNNVTDRWISDNSGNFLTKSVRPLTLIYMIIVLSVMAFMDGNIVDILPIAKARGF